jgi:hypothetical protein
LAGQVQEEKTSSGTSRKQQNFKDFWAKQTNIIEWNRLQTQFDIALASLQL